MRTATDVPPPVPTTPPASRLWWLVPAAAFFLLVIVAMVIGPPEPAVGHGTSYDASDAGYRAAYLLLEELKFPVERSRLAAGGSVRWVLDPTDIRDQDVANLDAWVGRGGVVLLATEDAEYAARLGLSVRPTRGTNSIATTGRDVGVLEADPAGVELVARAGRGWAGVRSADGSPLVTIVPHGNGAIWLLHRPGVLRNQSLRHADNAVFACRLAEAMLADRPGKLAFDEYCHGLRNRPTMAALLFRPPMLGVTLQALALMALVVWSVAPRFGPQRPTPPPSRRSKEEFLDAVADLLRRKGDYADAVETVRQDLRRRLGAAVGLPAELPVDELAREVERRRGVPVETTGMLSSPGPVPRTGSEFLAALHQLDSLRHEFFDRPRPGR